MLRVGMESPDHSMDFTKGSITSNMIKFALPLMAGNLLQQMYNLADAWVVGKFLGSNALAAVGSSYTLMTFLTSIMLGLCMGSGVSISMEYGRGASQRMRQCIFMSFCLILSVAVVLNIGVYAGLDGILWLLRVPMEVQDGMRMYLQVIFAGMIATFLYNYCANVLRAVGNSVVPLVFLSLSAVGNVVLDLIAVPVLHLGLRGAAGATVIAQYAAGIGILVYTLFRVPQLMPRRADCRWSSALLSDIWKLSMLTSLQQSIMNFGILMVQGLVNSFGAVTMAAFAAAVKIDSFAYMPVQDFGNAFSTYVAQNYGAGAFDRIKKGVRSAVCLSGIFCIVISAVVCALAPQLMGIFISADEQQIIQTGVEYLRIEGACYVGIGILFLLYGYYRAMNRPMMSVILTVASLGTRVVLAYALSAIPVIGVRGIWVSVPIGWALADLIGGGYMLRHRERLYR